MSTGCGYIIRVVWLENRTNLLNWCTVCENTPLNLHTTRPTLLNRSSPHIYVHVDERADRRLTWTWCPILLKHVLNIPNKQTSTNSHNYWRLQHIFLKKTIWRFKFSNSALFYFKIRIYIHCVCRYCIRRCILWEHIAYKIMQILVEEN